MKSGLKGLAISCRGYDRAWAPEVAVSAAMKSGLKGKYFVRLTNACKVAVSAAMKSGLKVALVVGGMIWG